MCPKITFNPDTSIPDLTGKVFFITGGTAGLGKETILALAAHNPHHIYFTGRNKERAGSVIKEVKQIAPEVRTTFCECDQTSLASVSAAASSFLSTNPARLDVLICNAGIMGGSPGLSKDGYEIQFGINFLAHALFIKRLVPLLERTAVEHGEARVVNLTSSAYAMQARAIPFEDLKSTQENIGMGGKWARYGQSKFAQVLYAAELAKRFPSITSVAIHPGVVHTALVEGQPLFDRLFLKMMTLGQSVPLKQGAYNTLWAATSEVQGNIRSGSVYYPVGVHMERTKAASDERQWKELWEWTEKQLR